MPKTDVHWRQPRNALGKTKRREPGGGGLCVGQADPENLGKGRAQCADPSRPAPLIGPSPLPLCH
ncbi:hypothetical protein E4P82_14460 [Candidatus Competibacter phosphatis]|uniref:Uncharacterized protein n=1 Tax=Candidatus Competibacter phosphatis TaxID=221280 RepID=A0ABX1TLL3_9GAMM|nr:hypothetical protein [Candidatus Competibacter phosphatis]NMQ20291.1 hypothetical protein [Candidatus Competibacter phosphatis]